MWTDNNPLTYILTKPKLDACKQRWVSKLAPYCFDIKYVPGKQNVVADAMSRAPFVKPLADRLLSEPCQTLLKHVCEVPDCTVQDAFRLTCQSQSIDSFAFSNTPDTSKTDDEISSLLASISEGDAGQAQRAAFLNDCLDSILPAAADVSNAFCLSDLASHQRNDPVISKVVFYVERGRHPSRTRTVW